MTLLGFDCEAVIDSAAGVTAHELDVLSPRLDVARAEMLEFGSRMLETCPGRVGTPEPGPAFFRLPEQLHAAYLAEREDSQLGVVFRVANGLSDDLDAVVVLGKSSDLHGARILQEACCDPYHNELSRAGRGSKPRMYFAGQSFDNDWVEAVGRRLIGHGADVVSAEGRFATVVIDPDEPSGSVIAAARQMSGVLDSVTGTRGNDWRSRLIVPVCQLMGRGRPDLQTPETGGIDMFRGTAERLHFSDGLRGPFGVTAPGCLLPAAMLGLDCMRFLQGAAEINEHFSTAPFAANHVLQFAAINTVHDQKFSRGSTSLQGWTQSLRSLAGWYQALKRFAVDEVDADRINAGDASRLVHHVTVRASRTDAISVTPGLTFAANEASALEAARQRESVAGVASTVIELPTIDTYYLGQLFQMLMLATWLQTRVAATPRSVCM